MTPTVKTRCSNCKAEVEVPAAAPTILNYFSVSLVIVEHPGSVVCSNCGLTVAAAIAEVGQIAIGAFPLPADKQNQRRIIVPGNGRPI